MKRLSNLKFNRLAVLFFFSALLNVFFYSCGKDDNENPDNGQPVNPGKTVDDPEGTVTLSMRNRANGHTYLDGRIYIDNENFEGGYFVSVGQVKGLGNVSQIPLKGWASSVSVIPGYGYVAFSGSQFYRIYVVDEIVGTTGGIIGADVKYQKPFKGVDEAISIDEKELTFNAEGGEQSVVFNNSNLVLFDCESSESWCRVQKSTTNDQWFLYNAVTIFVDPTSSTKTETATVTLKTVYGKTQTIKVNRTGNAPIIDVENDKYDVASGESSFKIGFTTNYELEDLETVNNNNWLSVSIDDGTYKMKAKASKIKFIGKQRVSVQRKESGAKYYSLNVNVSSNKNKNPRSGNVILRSKDKKTSKTISISQLGVSITTSVEQISLNCKDAEYSLSFSCPFDFEELSVKSSVDWCTSELVNQNGNYYVKVKASDNRNSSQREGAITISAKNSDVTATVPVVQNGANLTLSSNEISFEEKGGQKYIDIDCPFTANEIIAKADNTWCTSTCSRLNSSSLRLFINCEGNNSDKQRETTINITVAESDVSASVKIIQNPTTITGPADCWFDRTQSNYTITVKTSSGDNSWTVPKSNQSWCTVSKNGADITIRCEATTADRVATLTFPNFSNYKIKIHQSKYKVGDEYNEGKITGTVQYMDNTGLRTLRSADLGKAQWSTENVLIGANDRYDGTKNMEVVKAIPNWKTLYPAFALIEELNTSTSKGWYMPAVFETGRPSGCWSSTEGDKDIALYLRTDAYNTSTTKRSEYPVIAMRKF